MRWQEYERESEYNTCTAFKLRKLTLDLAVDVSTLKRLNAEIKKMNRFFFARLSRFMAGCVLTNAMLTLSLPFCTVAGVVFVCMRMFEYSPLSSFWPVGLIWFDLCIISVRQFDTVRKCCE